MNIETGTCKGCEKSDQPIVNKKYFFCPDCNHKRLHPESGSIMESKVKRSEELAKQKVKLASCLNQFNVDRKERIKGRTINKVSTTNSYRCSDGSMITQVQIEKKYLETIKMIDLSREPVCESCGRNDCRPLSHSHTISKKRCKELGKAELIFDENNLFLEGFEAPTSNPTRCHNIWEVSTLAKKQQLLTYKQKLAYIKEHDPETYRKIINK